jgi:hypothetical protein
MYENLSVLYFNLFCNYSHKNFNKNMQLTTRNIYVNKYFNSNSLNKNNVNSKIED